MTIYSLQALPLLPLPRSVNLAWLEADSIKMFVTTQSGDFRYEAVVRGKEEFGTTRDNHYVKSYTRVETAQDIILDIGCYNITKVSDSPELLLELYIDGILRNIVRPRTGRGLAYDQFAEAKIDRGIVMTSEGRAVMKRFHFTALDLDDAVLNSRLVKEAGSIEVRIIQAGITFNEEDDISFELPGPSNDRGAVSLLCGELNNTVGVRFDKGDESVRDTKEIRIKDSIEIMARRQNEMLGKTLAVFSFYYTSDQILHHLGMIPTDHKNYNFRMASVRQEVRFGVDERMSKLSITKSVDESDYTLVASIGEPNFQIQSMPVRSVPAEKLNIGQGKKRGRSAVDSESESPAKKRCGTAVQTPKKKARKIRAPVTPPATPPEAERTIVIYDMTQSDDKVNEIICKVCV